jgi:hypothetical protein
MGLGSRLEQQWELKGRNSLVMRTAEQVSYFLAFSRHSG